MQSSVRQRDLFDIAQQQGGYFTAKQAAGLGYSGSKRNYHVRAGNWVREHRGIYRLTLFPPSERPDLILWWLWSRGRDDQPAGVFSHRTALSLHNLTDTNPAKIDLTVPPTLPTFRRGTAIPSVLRLHRSAVTDDEREMVSGVPVTTALRSILDSWREGSVPQPELQNALGEAMRTGKVTKRQIDQARKDPDCAAILSTVEGASR
jgi:predicted transcriptional regulator of viral defense system